MAKSIIIIKRNQEHVTDIFKDGIKTNMIFREIQKDTVGRSGASPTWGYAYSNKEGKMKFEGVALHKEYDYDFPMAAYAEKAWSILGKEILGENVRVPDIDIVKQDLGYEEIISYRLMDNNKEEMIHIEDVLFNKFEREEINSRKEIFSIEEILECVKMQIKDEENYKKVEKDIIQVLMLDAITNNGDRHVLNWGLVRDKKTSEYTLAIFDHSTSFIDMFQDKSRFLINGWASTYITVGNDNAKNYIGSNGKKVIDYIFEQYPEYFDNFCDSFDANINKALEIIKQQEMKIDFTRLSNKMGERKNFLKKLRSRGELEYGE